MLLRQRALRVAGSVVSRLVLLGSDTDLEELEAFGHGAKEGSVEVVKEDTVEVAKEDTNK